MIYLINDINKQIIGEFEGIRQLHAYVQTMSRFQAQNAYIIEGEKKSIGTHIVYELEGETKQRILEGQ
ncbi:MAG TPA: hypothetical protein ENI23_16250 [bacterium]|nr:hypothetical protein [bacterium]